ncbi:hypothetical protein ILUMI_05895, partial [Ignelater luminosus]
MTVNKNATPSTKTKKKSSSSTETTSASATTSTASTATKVTKKVVGSSSKTTEVSKNVSGVVGTSRSSSSSSLKIADISHIPEAPSTSLVTYSVTESFPQGGGESITTYNAAGGSSVEYRHFINQESSSSTKQSSDITQVSSILNRSTTNLSTISDDSNATYIVTEPKEEIRYTYNKNDSGWNGKFVLEQPVQKKGTIVEQSSSSNTQQSSSSVQKSSSSSYVIEIVDGKERIVDQKHHESGFSTAASNEEHTSARSGTNITPELHHVQKKAQSSTVYDTAVPELTQPQTKGSKMVKEFHKVGGVQTSNVYETRDNEPLPQGHMGRITHDTNWDGTFVLEKTDSAKIKKAHTSSDSRNFYGHDSTVKTSKIKDSQTFTDSKNFHDLGTDTITTTTTTTYYDADGKVVNVVTDVENKNSPPTHRSNVTDTKKSQVIKDDTSETVTRYVDTSKTRTAQSTTDSRDFYGRGVDSKNTTVKNVYDTTATQSTTGTRGKVVKDRTSDSTDTRKSTADTITTTSTITYYDADGNVVNVVTDVENKNIPSTHRSNVTDTKQSHVIKDDTSESVTRYVDENYVDTSKIRTAQSTTDSRDFFGHGVDSRNTVVKNVYDSTATQNTIGTRGKVIKDHTIDSSDVVYSNERTYGKTSWNGQFVYETPVKPKKPTDTSPQKGSKQDKPSKERDSPTKGRTSPSRESPTRTTTTSRDSPTRTTPSRESPTRTAPRDGKRPPSGSRSPDRKHPQDETTTTTYYVDENYVDTAKIRNAQSTTDSRNFYGHTVDSKNTVVNKVYDSSATQNTIGTRGTVIKDNTIDSTDVVYSNERTYGKTNWNGKFVYETPVKPQKGPQDDKPKDGKKSPTSKEDTPKTQKSPTDKTTTSFERITDTSDSKTTIVRDSKTFVDDQSTVDYYTVIEGQQPRGPRGPDDYPSGRRPEGQQPRGPKSPDDYPGGRRPEGQQPRGPKGPDDYPGGRRPEGQQPRGPRRPDDYPDDKSHPRRPGDDTRPRQIRGPDGKLQPYDKDRYPTDLTTIESYETVTDYTDSKTTVTRDSKTFVDKHSTFETYTTTDVYDGDKPKGPKGGPHEPKSIRDGPRDQRHPRYPSDITDSKTTVIRDSQTFLDDQRTFETYTTTDVYDDKGPRGPGREPKDTPKGPSRGPHDKLEPYDKKHPRYPGSTTIVEDTTDSKTTVI